MVGWFSYMIVLLKHLTIWIQKFKVSRKQVIWDYIGTKPKLLPKWTIEIPIEVWKSLHHPLNCPTFRAAQHFPTEPERGALRSLWSAVSQVFQTHAWTKKLQDLIRSLDPRRFLAIFPNQRGLEKISLNLRPTHDLPISSWVSGAHLGVPTTSTRAA